MLRTLAKTLLVTFGIDSAHADDFESLSRQAASEAPRYALGVGYAKTGEPPVTMTFGPIHKDTSRPVAADAQWHIGSITKSFTAALVMRFVDRQILSLDEPIEAYLPTDKGQMHAHWRGLTLRQLLSHTSGLQANAPMADFSKRSDENLHSLRRAVLAPLWTSPLPNPSDAYLYSNLGYVLAGFIVEEVSGRSWEELVLEELASPLGLKSLGFGAPSEEGAPWGHRDLFLFKRKISPQGEITDNPPWLGPAGTIHLNLKDLLRWGQAQIAACKGEPNSLLSAASCQEMRKVVAENYGLGWVIETDKEAPYIWHNGSNSMWYAKLVILTEHDLVLVAATNVFDAKGIDELVDKLRLTNPVTDQSD
ncbi:serine hydrolase domain-containing protein [uncultured Roseibium sp.]|uniref:serine hydrolase domain-containing protein n=1 Tax=uncultured Roseibium sp. TaxID=1936171 RepID=UPI00260D0297|nr:serine hydrolase domain-containing protein [uncultured Roseibium sp.]